MRAIAILTWKPERLLAYFQQWSGMRRARAVNAAMRAEVKRAEAFEESWQLDEALKVWSSILARHPTYVHGQAAYGRVLGKTGRDREAIVLLRDVTAAAPDLIFISAELTNLLCKIGSYEEALDVARAVVARFPNLPSGPMLEGKTLRHMNRFDEADAILLAAQAQFPESAALFVEHVAVADVRGDWAEALRRSETIVRKFPDSAMAFALLGAALKKTKQFDAADRVLLAAAARFPDNSNIAVNYAWVADARGDWAEALRRWTGIVERFGAEPRVRAGYNESLSHAELARLDEVAAAPDAATVAAPPPAPVLDAEATRYQALFDRFQALGRNCEFGFVQRHFGAEPMGLLRWAGIELDKLLFGLDHDFDGVGGAERTRLDCNENNTEYYTTDTFYGLSMHTFVLRGSAGDKDLYAKMCRRLSFLRTRLLEDLREGEKLFVFNAGPGPSGEEDARTLHRALRRHGPGRLLFVRLAREGEVPGTVQDLGDGLALGLLDHDGLHGNYWAISFPCWLALAQAADALFAPTPAAAGA